MFYKGGWGGGGERRANLTWNEKFDFFFLVLCKEISLPGGGKKG